MKSNPYASYAATSTDDDGWMTTRKSGRDDNAIKQAAEAAEEARKAKNRRGGNNASRKGPARGAKRGGGKRKNYDSSDEESFMADHSDDEQDDFIVHSDEEEASLVESEEGDWNSDLEDDDSEDGKKKKGKKKAGATKKAAKKKVGMKKAVNNRSIGIKRGVRNKGKQPVYDVDESDDEVDQSIEDDIYDSSPEQKKPAKKSPYFAKNDSETDEEKKEEDLIIKPSKKKKKTIIDDSDSDEDLGFGLSNFAKSNDTDLMDDTPVKTGLEEDDYISDDDEAAAVAQAIKESMKDGRKRLKKKVKKSSLEILDAQPKLKKKKSEIVYLDDVEEEEPENASGDDDGEISVASRASDDEEQKTAAQVLNEANALSAKIVKIVGQWCGEQEGISSKGLILGDEGALSLGGGGGPTQFTQADDDNEWISKETMKKIMPTVELADYQLLGVNWMALLNRLTFMKGSGIRGKKDGKMNVNGILADEMGLGKTVQTIAFLAWLNYQKGGGTSVDNAISIDEVKKSSIEAINLDETMDSDNDDTFMQDNSNDCSAKNPTIRRPHLIVVPASVLSNWMNEFQKFAPHMTVVKYHGNQNEREEIKYQMRKYLPVDKDTPPNAHLDAVLTTFSYFSSEKGEDRTFLRKFHFDYLIVDEGHQMKNPKGLRYKNLNKFLTSHRLLLTGTPVQNSPKELMSLLCFLMPLFDSKTKSSKGFDSDDEKGSDGGERMLEHFVHLEAADGGDAAAYRKLKQLFAPFVLRRKKSDVLSQIMPPKTRKVDLVDMDEATRSVYDAILDNAVKGGTVSAGQANGLAKFKSMSAQKHLFTELRKAANHPLLLRTRHLNDTEINYLALRMLNYNYFGSDATCTLQLVKNELEKMSDYDIHCAASTMIDENSARREHLEKYTLVENDLFCSPKFVRLRALLPELIEKGHRILLFSQWTRVLDLMHNLLEMLGMKFLRLDGQTDVTDRQALIDTFTNDPTIPVFLLSTRAGGMGLNLTAADVCILHDLDFNPFNDLQAEDRCHRIGQKKPVTIIKMVTRGTVDEMIYSLQERKEKMNEAIMDEKGNTKQAGGGEDMKEIMKSVVGNFLKSPKGKVTKGKPVDQDVEKSEIISIDD